jgi:hypothetical protein
MEYNSKYVKVVQNRLEAMVPLGQKVLLNNPANVQNVTLEDVALLTTGSLASAGYYWSEEALKKSTGARDNFKESMKRFISKQAFTSALIRFS